MNNIQNDVYVDGGTVHSIQLLRFFAAFIVVVYHTSLALDVYGMSSLSGANFADFFALGEAGVHIFFVISGFIMVYTTIESDRGYNSAAVFMYRRFIRIYPIYWVVCIFYVIFHYSLLQPYDISISDFLKALMLWPGYSAKIIGPGWTLSYEIYFYLCFSVTLLVPAISGLIALTIGMLFLIILGFVFDLRSKELQVLTNPLLLEFLLGAWIAVFCLSRYRLPTRLADLSIAVAVIMFLVPAWLDVGSVPSVLLMGGPSALLILGCVMRERDGRLPSFVRSWSALGNGSYSLYLLHNLTIDLVLLGLVALGATAALGWLWAIVAIAVSCIAASYIHQRIEKPAHRHLAGINYKPVPAASR
jgi:exopolysaccharide production protein ExoZ